VQHSWWTIYSWQEIIVLCSNRRVSKTSAVKAFDGIQCYYRREICSRVFSCLGGSWEEKAGAANNCGIPTGALALAVACQGMAGGVSIQHWQASHSSTDHRALQVYSYWELLLWQGCVHCRSQILKTTRRNLKQFCWGGGFMCFHIQS